MKTYSERMGLIILDKIQKSKYSTEDFCNKLNISDRDLLRILDGNALIPPYIINKMSEILEVKKSDLMPNIGIVSRIIKYFKEIGRAHV